MSNSISLQNIFHHSITEVVVFIIYYHSRGPKSGEYVPYEEIKYHFGVVCMGWNCLHPFGNIAHCQQYVLVVV